MHTKERFDALVGQIYDAVLSAPQWAAALRSVADSLDCEMFHAFVWDRLESRPTVAWAAAHATADMFEDYDHHFGRIDPKRQVVDHSPAGRIFCCTELLTQHEVDRSEFYQDFLLPHGLRYWLGGTLTRDDRHETTVALLRGPDRPAFSDSDLQWACRLAPHLQRAARLLMRQQTWAEALAAGEAALEQMQAGATVLDAERVVLHANATARSLFNSTSALRVQAGRLEAQEAGTARALAAAWHRLLTRGEPQELLLVRPQPLVLTLCHWPEPGADAPLARARGRRFLATVVPLQRTPPSLAQLKGLFDLSPAEARLAQRLACGSSLPQAAQELGVKPATVRSQMLQILAKTGARRQQALMALLVRLPALGR